MIRAPLRVDDLRRHVEQVTGEEQPTSFPLEENDPVAGRMAGRVNHAHPGDDLTVAGVEVQQAEILEWRHGEAAREGRRGPLLSEERPIIRVHMMAGVRESSIAVGEARAPRMVGVQMGVDDMLDVVGCRAGGAELLVDPAHHVVPRRPQVSDARVDEDQAVGRTQQERVDVPRPPVGAVGREGPWKPPSFFVPIDVLTRHLLGER